jgi:hypothetical protein
MSTFYKIIEKNVYHNFDLIRNILKNAIMKSVLIRHEI